MSLIDRVAATLRAAGSVWAEDEAAILVAEAPAGPILDALVARRVDGEPLETIVGWVRFLDRRLVVAPGVFVPRCRTELLARTALARVAAHHVVVEMCCGVAPIAAVLTGLAAEVHAADVSSAALECAALNAPGAWLHRGDLFAALPVALSGRVDLVVANAPYVPTGRIAAMPREARDHEPRVTLDGGADGVEMHRRLATGVRSWLRPGGVLLVETGPGQVQLTTDAMQRAGLTTSIQSDHDNGGCVAIGVTAAGPA